MRSATYEIVFRCTISHRISDESLRPSFRDLQCYVDQLDAMNKDNTTIGSNIRLRGYRFVDARRVFRRIKWKNTNIPFEWSIPCLIRDVDAPKSVERKRIIFRCSTIKSVDTFLRVTTISIRIRIRIRIRISCLGCLRVVLTRFHRSRRCEVRSIVNWRLITRLLRLFTNTSMRLGKWIMKKGRSRSIKKIAQIGRERTRTIRWNV